MFLVILYYHFCNFVFPTTIPGADKTPAIAVPSSPTAVQSSSAQPQANIISCDRESKVEAHMGKHVLGMLTHERPWGGPGQMAHQRLGEDDLNAAQVSLVARSEIL